MVFKISLKNSFWIIKSDVTSARCCHNVTLYKGPYNTIFYSVKNSPRIIPNLTRCDEKGSFSFVSDSDAAGSKWTVIGRRCKECEKCGGRDADASP